MTQIPGSFVQGCLPTVLCSVNRIQAGVLTGVLLAPLAWILFTRHNPPSTASGNELLGPTMLESVWETFKQAVKHEPGAKHRTWSLEYGSTFQYRLFTGRKRIYSADPTAIAYVLKNHTEFPKSKLSSRYLSLFVGCELSHAETTDHHQQSRILSHFFGTKSLAGALPIFYDKAEIMREKLLELSDESDTGQVNIEDLAQRCAMDIIGVAGLDHELRALEDPNTDLVAAFRNLVSDTQGLSIWRWLLRLKRNKRPFWVQDDATRALRGELALQCVDVDGYRPDMEDLLKSCLRARSLLKPGDRDHLSDDEILDQITKFMSSGSETVATALTWTLHLLAKHPIDQARLRAECLSIEQERPPIDALNALTFLDAVVKEGLRLIPPVPATSRAAKEDVVLPLGSPIMGKDGEMVNKLSVRRGTSIYIPIDHINTLEEAWGPNPSVFRPSRHLELPSLVQASRPTQGTDYNVRAESLTFLAGARRCIGYRFAPLEIKAILFVLVTGTDFAEPYHRPLIESTPGLINRPRVLGQTEKGAQLPLIITPVDDQN